MNRIQLIKNIEKYIKFVKFHNIVSLEDIEIILMNENLNSNESCYLKKVLNKILLNETYKISNDGELLSNRGQCVVIKEYNDEEFEKIKQNFDIIRSIKSPKQRSAAWFALRHKVISASDGGTALGLNKFEAQYKFIYKKVFGSTFETNQACYWGKCFENAVVRSYEYLNDCIVDEFGLLPNKITKIISASPDGIVKPYRKDGSKSHIPSRMVEIKCIVSRELKFTGEIYDNICPQYYWVQTQLQMQTTNINECDFAQYEIGEYNSKGLFLEDTHDKYEFMSKKTNLERGILIEMVPVNLSEDNYIEGYIKKQAVFNTATHIYPPKIDLTIYEMDEWEKEIKLKLNNSEIFEEIEDIDGNIIDTIYYKYNTTKYYYVIKRNCTLIVKDDKWFEDKLPTFETVWDNVLYLRNNTEVANTWKQYIDKMTRKTNNTIIAKLEELTGIKIKQ